MRKLESEKKREKKRKKGEKEREKGRKRERKREKKRGTEGRGKIADQSSVREILSKRNIYRFLASEL